MRMWMVDTSKMCINHLLGEHVELHMLIGCIEKNKNIKGFINNGLIELNNIYSRHEELKNEIIKRGYKHKSELPMYGKSIMQLYFKYKELGKIDIEKNIVELKNRCKKCKF